MAAAAIAGVAAGIYRTASPRGEALLDPHDLIGYLYDLAEFLVVDIAPGLGFCFVSLFIFGHTYIGHQTGCDPKQQLLEGQVLSSAGGYSWDGVRHSGRQFCAVAGVRLF